jgi:murein DD-endopeptidase MepM/ murein hydrolase activator NlpD
MNNSTFTPQEEPTPQRRSHATRLLIPSLLLLAITLFLLFSGSQKLQASKQVATTPSLKTLSPLETLLYSQLPELLALQEKSNWVLDDIQFSDDKTQAMLWLAEQDQTSGLVTEKEPEIILAMWNAPSQRWELHLSNSSDFIALLTSSWFKGSEITSYFVNDDSKPGPTGVVYGGYKLPWRANLTKRLTWSVGHSSCTPQYYCTFAFDFADGTMFEILAAKSGYVYHWRDTCANGNPNCTNSITIEDRSTSPWTYQIYMHIAQNSIPLALKTTGIFVAQGQKIANADDTGYSTGHHLHFMVVEKNTLSACVNYCFGRAVDITFRDVDINWDAGTQGGRPRLASEAAWYGGTGRTNYTSANTYYTGVLYFVRFPRVWR